MEKKTAIDKIHEFLKFGSVLGLERMETLMSKLGNPQDKLKVIHIAGTNGKGSVSRYTYEALRAMGYSVGLFTSPFLEVFNERIEINGKYISNIDLEKYTEIVLEKAREIVEEGGESPTEFEIVTAISFVYFADKNCDFTVLEVGLGGRGDSTNIIKNPICCAITSISLDHTDILGDSISKIAMEKAGIIKKNSPIVLGAKNEEARKVIISRAKEMDAPLIDTTSGKVNIKSESINSTVFDATVMGAYYDDVTISMIGTHQVENANIAIHILEILKSRGELSEASDFKENMKKGLLNAKQIGRFEVLSCKNNYVIIDGAHNVGGSVALKETVNKFFKGKKILMVVGILKDKAVDDVVCNFLDITNDFIVTEPPNPRKLKSKDFARIFKAHGGNVIIENEPIEAVKKALEASKCYDLVLFSGSLYLIGLIRGEIINGLR